MRVTEQELKEAFNKYGYKYEGRREDYFALLYLSKEFNRQIDDIASQVAFGGNDYGIDAFYIDKERKNLYLYQFKWSDNHALFRESLERLRDKGMEQIFGNPTQDPSQNKLLSQLKAELNENKSIIERVLIHFVFNGDVDKAERSKVLDYWREELENKKYLIDNYFGKTSVTLTFEYKSNKTRERATIAHAIKTYEYDINFELASSKETSTGEKLYVGFIPLMDLYGMYKEMGQRFFERNIRSSLSPEKPPNLAIRRALKDIIIEEKVPPEVFVFNHNGVTLSAQAFTKNENRYHIVEPRLLNGAQTITSLGKFIEDNKNNGALTRNEQKLRSVSVIAKIVYSTSDDFITNVTICNNKQNPVEPWHLRANDLIQRQFQDKFHDELHIYYERQENAFTNRHDSDLEKEGIEESKPIKIKELAKTFLAVQGEVDYMSRLKDAFEDEKIYKNTFKDSYLECDLRKIILAYKIQFRLRRIIAEIQESSTNKYEYVSHASNLVWALLIQGLLNDRDLPERCELYGNDLSIAADYKDYLKKMAPKIRTIMNEAFSDKKYRDDISQEKYSFLRTKEAYRRCMEVASEKYGWSKRSF